MVFFSGIVLGCLAITVIIGAIAVVAIKGVPKPVKDLYTDTKESLVANSQYQHTVMNATYSGAEENF